MYNYILHLETVDNNGEINSSCFIESIDAESLEDCLKKAEWDGFDAEEDEQYCISEEDEEYGDRVYYYPFGKAKILEEIKKRPKYPDNIMRNVRQALGLEPDDMSMNEEINDMDQIDVFDKWLQWEGILGYANTIKDAVDNIFYGK